MVYFMQVKVSFDRKAIMAFVLVIAFLAVVGVVVASLGDVPMPVGHSIDTIQGFDSSNIANEVIVIDADDGTNIGANIEIYGPRLGVSPPDPLQRNIYYDANEHHFRNYDSSNETFLVKTETREICLRGNCISSWPAGGGGLWSQSGSDIYYDVAGGKVGVGTDIPGYKLDVAGQINLNKGISSGVALLVNGVEALWFDGDYFSWGFGGNKNYFADPVGIGTNNPSSILQVQSNTPDSQVYISGLAPRLAFGDNVVYGSRDKSFRIAMASNSGDFGLSSTYGDGVIFTEANDTLTAGDGDIIFATPSGIGRAIAERMRIAQGGDVKISGLTNCNTIDTDASGKLTCGTDEGLGGSGTSGTVPRWTSSGTLGNSLIDSPAAGTPNGTVGIDGYLQVRGSSAASSFLGSVIINQDLLVSGNKNFDIEHPNPQKAKEGWRLRHSTIESPQVRLYYEGKGVIENGIAVIKLPEYFKDIVEENTEIVHLTKLSRGDVWVKKEDYENTKVIVKGEEGTEFSWLISGVRKGYSNFEPEYNSAE